MLRNHQVSQYLATIVALLLLAGLLAACAAPSGRRESSAFQISLPWLQAAPTAAAPAGVDAGGMLVALGRHGHLSVLTDSGWVEPATPGDLGQGASCQPGEVAVGFGEGEAWAQCRLTVNSTDGNLWQEAQPSFPGKLYFGPDGWIVKVSTAEVTLFQNDRQVTYQPRAALGAVAFPGQAATFAPDGTLWLAGGVFGAPQLVSFDGKAWRVYGESPIDVGLQPGDQIAALAVDRNGVLYAATKDRVLYFDGSRFKDLLGQEQLGLAIRIPSFGGAINGLLALPDGELWLATSEGIFVWNGRQLSVIDRGEGLPARDVRALAVDSRGRIWAATAYGLAVREGSAWHVALPATSGLAESDLVALAVRGAPELPAPDPQPKTATLSGRVVSAGAGGQPVPNAPVILCDEWPGASQRHAAPLPCADDYTMRLGKTDGNGWYKFDNVPLGSYTLAVHEGDNWFYSLVVGTQEKLPLVALTPGQQVRMDIGLP